jgi:hypothetical protein
LTGFEVERAVRELRRTEEMDMVEVVLALIQLLSLASALFGLLRYFGAPATITLGCPSYLGISDVCIKGVPFLSVVLSLFLAGIISVVSRLRKMFLDLKSRKAVAS